MKSSEKNPFQYYLYDSRSRTFLKLRDGTILGRTEGDIQVPHDDMISRKHCSFTISGNEIYIEDFDSTNRTKVNSVPIRSRVRRRIRLHDVIEIGKQRLVLCNQDKVDLGHHPTAPKKKTYKAIRKNDGSLTAYLTRLITKRTRIEVNWVQYQQLRLQHELQPIRQRLSRARRPQVKSARSRPGVQLIKMTAVLILVALAALGGAWAGGMLPNGFVQSLQQRALASLK